MCDWKRSSGNVSSSLLVLVSSQNIKKSSFLCVLRGITRNVCTVSTRDFGNVPYFLLLSLYIAARQFTTSCEVTWSADGTIPDCTVERMILDGRCATYSDAFRLQATRNATVDRFETLSTWVCNPKSLTTVPFSISTRALQDLIVHRQQTFSAFSVIFPILIFFIH